MKKISMMIVAGVAVITTAFADITISPTSRDWVADGGGATVSTIGSGSWTATTDASWITLVKSSGTAGQACTYLVAKNPDADVRVGHITIAGNVFTVTQQGCSVELSPASADFNRYGGSGKFTASMDVAVTWTAAASDSWITLSPSSGVGPTEISYTIAAYDAVGSRTGTIRIGSDSFTINQTGVDVTLTPTVTNITKEVCIVPIQVVAMASVRWTVTPNVSWISVLDGGNGFGGSQVTFAVAENPSFAKRTGTVSVGSAIFTVIQEGTDDVSFKILPEVAEASPKGAFGNVAVYATPDATWSAESLDEWIRITAGAEGAGNGNVKYVTLSNPEQTSRTGYIKFTPPVVTPDFDLYAGLLFWIKDQTNIEGNEERKATYPLSKMFDGSFANPLAGAAMPAKDVDDYTLSLSFKVGELDCVNRLFKIGGHTVYLDEDNILYYHTLKTDFTVENAEQYYTLVLRVAGDRRLTVYAGEKDSELHAVWSGLITGQLTFSGALAMSAFNLGYGEQPSVGYLQSGQFANIRFWTRALTDRECECVDTRQNEMLEMKPAGISGDVKYDFFPLNGNMFGADETSSAPYAAAEKGAESSGWNDVEDRQRVKVRAIGSAGNGTVTFPDLNKLFEGSYIAYSDEANFSRNNYSVRTHEATLGGGVDAYWFPPRQVEPNCNEDTSFTMWFKIDALPENAVTIYDRMLSADPLSRSSVLLTWGYYYDGGRASAVWTALQNMGSLASNFQLSVILLPDGSLKIRQVTAKGEVYKEDQQTYYYRLVADTTKVQEDCLGKVPVGEWTMLTIVGKSEKSILVYLNDMELGSVVSKMWFGYMPPLDLSFIVNLRGYSYSTFYGEESWGSAYDDKLMNVFSQHPCKLTVGGWNGSLDEITFHQKALSAKEIKGIYQAGHPAHDVYHTVNQRIQQPELSVDRIEIGKAGGASNVTLTVANGVKWTVVPNVDWLSVAGDTSGAGSANLNVQIAPNPTIVLRTGTMQIGAKTLTVVQEGLNCTVTAEQTIFDVDSTMGVIEVSPEQNGQWTVSTDVDWIYLAEDSGVGSQDVNFFVDYFDDPHDSRTGTILIGDKAVYITQRGYELSIEPMIAEVGGNAGAGEIGVAADEDAIWTAISSVPWIKIVQGADGIGKGTIRYTFTDNTTGQTRTGHIRVSGQDYVLTQTCTLELNTFVVGQGQVTGGGNYAQGREVTLQAVPANGYAFSHWSGDMVGVETTGTLKMDSVKNVTATFIPEAAAQKLAEQKAAQGGFYTRDQIHALEMGNLVFDVDASGTARVGVQLMETSDLSDPNSWKPATLNGNPDVGQDGTVGMKVKAEGNAKFFKVVMPDNK